MQFQNNAQKPGEQFGGNPMAEMLFADNASESNLRHNAGRFEYGAPVGREIVGLKTVGGRCVGCESAPVAVLPELLTDLVFYLRWMMSDTVRLLATLSGSAPSAAERKYAFQLLSAMGFSFLPEFKDMESKILTMDFPSFWDRSAMQGIQIAATGSGLELDPRLKGKNWFASITLGPEDVALFQTLFDQTHRKKYTRDRKHGEVPDFMTVVEVRRCQNLQNWAEYAEAKKALEAELGDDGPTSSGGFDWSDCKFDGALPESDPRFQLDAATNERFLFHGTSAEAADFITQGDFRIDKAGSNAGTLYGRGVYLAESCSKSRRAAAG